MDALYPLGNVDLNGSEPAQARVEYARVVALDPSDAQAHVALGDLTTTSLETMRSEFAAATQLDPFNAMAQNNLADACLDLGLQLFDAGKLAYESKLRYRAARLRHRRQCRACPGGKREPRLAFSPPANGGRATARAKLARWNDSRSRT